MDESSELRLVSTTGLPEALRSIALFTCLMLSWTMWFWNREPAAAEDCWHHRRRAHRHSLRPHDDGGEQRVCAAWKCGCLHSLAAAALCRAPSPSSRAHFSDTPHRPARLPGKGIDHPHQHLQSECRRDWCSVSYSFRPIKPHTIGNIKTPPLQGHKCNVVYYDVYPNSSL